MKNACRYFLAVSCCFVSLCAGTAAVAQRAPGPLKRKQEQVIILAQTKPRSRNVKGGIRADDFIPSNSIRVNVRYRKEYGYRWTEGGFASSGPTSCDAFLISARLEEGDVRPRNLIPIGGDSQMRESPGYYTCKYLISDLPFNTPVKIVVTVPNNREAWPYGSQPQPQPGQERRI
jgi:hypothetical protein